jgi:electron-transferring-flavoprotein dehydrogenase
MGADYNSRHAAESMQYDVVVVGGGPRARRRDPRQAALARVSVCVLEKGLRDRRAHPVRRGDGSARDYGAHPDWQAQGAPLNAPVTEDRFLFLTQGSSYRVPDFMLPAASGTTAITWSASATSAAGSASRRSARRRDLPGFPAADVLYNENGSVKGVVTGDMGVGRDGQPTDAYQPGMELHGKYTFFAEGCRGHLGRRLQERFKLREGVDPQVYGIGLKELWELKPEHHKQGLVMHTAAGRSTRHLRRLVLYHMENNQVASASSSGWATQSLLSPYEEFQRYKTHPASAAFSRAASAVAYGARAIAAGGLQSLPKLVFPAAR